MKGILLVIPRGEMLDEIASMLAPDFEALPCETLTDSWDGIEQTNAAAALVDLTDSRAQGLALAKRLQDQSPFSEIPILGLSAALPGEDDAACIEQGFFDIIPLPCPRQLLIKRIQNAIRASDSLTFHEMERMLKQLPSNIFLKDTQCRYVFATQYWRHLKNADDPNWTIRGKTDLEIRKDKQNALKAMEADREILRTGKGTNYIIEENQDGISEFLELIKRPVYDRNGKISGIIALINNVTERHLLEIELEKRSRLDPLTELLNKRSTEEFIRGMLSETIEGLEAGALMMIDVDNFKRVNDTLGHAAGDKVLSEIARIIRGCFRVTDVTGRIGGDEFMVFLHHIKGRETVCRLADRLLRQVESAFKDLPCQVSLSIGIAIYPAHGAAFETLYKAADHALYCVKNSRKGTYRLYEPES